MNLMKWMMPLGVASYVCLFLAVAFGLLKSQFKMRWVKLNWHIWFGIAALVFGTAHAAIIFLNY